jgi:hypothetical protein
MEKTLENSSTGGLIKKYSAEATPSYIDNIYVYENLFHCRTNHQFR